MSLQETKFKVAGKHRLNGYIVYEHLRTKRTAGGGILLAVLQEVSPALVREGGGDVEAVTVDINVKKDANCLYISLCTTGKRFS